MIHFRKYAWYCVYSIDQCKYDLSAHSIYCIISELVLVSSASRSSYHGGSATRCFTRLYEFKWIFQRNGRMELSFSPGKTSNYSFSKLKTFSDAKKFLVVVATTFFFDDDVFFSATLFFLHREIDDVFRTRNCYYVKAIKFRSF